MSYVIRHLYESGHAWIEDSDQLFKIIESYEDDGYLYSPDGEITPLTFTDFVHMGRMEYGMCMDPIVVGKEFATVFEAGTYANAISAFAMLVNLRVQNTPRNKEIASLEQRVRANISALRKDKEFAEKNLLYGAACGDTVDKKIVQTMMNILKDCGY